MQICYYKPLGNKIGVSEDVFVFHLHLFIINFLKVYLLIKSKCT